jgi:hypothetical protein
MKEPAGEFFLGAFEGKSVEKPVFYGEGVKGNAMDMGLPCCRARDKITKVTPG